MAKAVKKTTKAATPVVEKTVEVKEEVKVTPVVEEVKAEVKEEVKKAPAKKATAKKEVKEEAKKAPAKKAATKKATLTTTVTLQFAEKSYTEESLTAIAKDVWKYDLEQKEADLKTVELYVKPEEGLCYYVFNGDVTGNFVI
ncbi:MAG: DNA-binding protein [Lachnospiraceae bacterium]|nr:DNA-binding protein [Lachnospiraceae bacterium]